MSKMIRIILYFIVLQSLAACGGSDNDTQGNQAPTAAVALESQRIPERETVVLDGSSSDDTDGRIASFLWEQIDGPSIIIENAASAVANFSAPEVEDDTELSFQLTVTDNDNAKASATVTVLIEDADELSMPPIANAGTDQGITEGTLVSLDGSASLDPDGGFLVTLNWEQMAGPEVSLTAPNQPVIEFIAPNVPTDGAELVFRLTVTDDEGESAWDEVSIAVQNIPPPVAANALYLGAKYRLGAGAFDGVLADFNGDGHLDLASANTDANNISVLLGRGDGTFEPPNSFPLDGLAPAALVNADLDGDDHWDLVVANSQSENINVLLGRGDGTFGEAVAYAAGSEPARVIAAHLDGDDALDVVCTNFTSADLSVFFGNGDGTLREAVSIPMNNAPEGIAAADLDFDGDQDLVVASPYENTVVVLPGQGDGVFLDPASYPVGSESVMAPIRVDIADLNGDGRPDLVSSNMYSGNLSVLLDLGDASFAEALTFPVGVTPPPPLPLPSAMQIADLDRDGHQDAVAVINTAVEYDAELVFDWLETDVDAYDYIALDNLALLVGSGDGRFATPVWLPTGRSPTAVMIGDLDLDDDLDLVTINQYSADASVWLNDGAGHFPLPPTYPVAIMPNAIDAADLNGDGHVDMVVGSLAMDDPDPFDAVPATQRSELQVFMADGQGGFDAPWRMTVVDTAINFKLAELTGDNTIDILIANPRDNQVTPWVGDGNGSFVARAPITVADFAGSFEIIDMNGDGQADIVMMASLGIAVLHGQGNGEFAEPVDYPIPAATVFLFGDMAIADLNGDERLDVIATAQFSGEIAVALGQEDGHLGEATIFSVGEQAAPATVQTADLNGDGRLDLLVTNPSLLSDQHTLSVLFGEGDGGFSAPSVIPIGAQIGKATIVDADGDADLDIMVANTSANELVFLDNQGDGHFARNLAFTVGTQPVAIASADLNADSKPDLLVANHGSNDVTILIHQ